MLVSLKEFLSASHPENLHESIIGKGYAIAQNRAHGANKNRLQSISSRIKGTARQGMNEEDLDKRLTLLFSLFQDLAEVLRIQSEMSRNSINVGTAGVLDMESVKKELRRFHKKR